MKIRLYNPQNLTSGELLKLEKNQAHYVSNVLRCRAGDEVFMFNAENGEFACKVAGKGEVEIGKQTREPKPETPLTLLFAPVKFGKIDLLVTKATELGVTKLQPVKTKYTQVDRIKYERMEANAIEAAEQTGRLSVPEIAEMQPLEKYISTWNPEHQILFCDEAGDVKPIKQALEGFPKSAGYAVLIGPEGGFTKDEASYLRSRKFITPATMGERLLRAETAALAAVAVLQAVIGDWQ